MILSYINILVLNIDIATMYEEFQLMGLVGRVFANGLGYWGSFPGRVIPKTQKMVLDTSLLNTQHYKIHIKGKVEKSRGRSSTHPTTQCSSY